MKLILAFFIWKGFQIIFSKEKNPPSLSIFYGEIIPIHSALHMSCLFFIRQESSQAPLPPHVGKRQ